VLGVGLAVTACGGDGFDGSEAGGFGAGASGGICRRQLTAQQSC
jgi:hypothetical protein